MPRRTEYLVASATRLRTKGALVPLTGPRRARSQARQGAIAADHARGATLEDLLEQVARGDQHAFELFYGQVAGSVYGLVRRIVRDPAQSEEVTQEVLVEVWRTATRFDPTRGSARSWALAMAHRRAVDRVRSAQSAAARDDRAGRDAQQRAYDEVAEQVETRLEQEQVRRGLTTLTDLQREAVTLAYYGGYTYREVAELLDVPLGTVKTRLRDGLIRLRDYLGVEA
jgi:RNA polymerase sigma-70 factor (ECF subfamily)